MREEKFGLVFVLWCIIFLLLSFAVDLSLNHSLLVQNLLGVTLILWFACIFLLFLFKAGEGYDGY